MLEFLLKFSDIAKTLAEDSPVTLEELLGSYCETPEKFTCVTGLLERLPRFVDEKLKLSNCLIRNELPYDSLLGLTKEDLDELYKVMDYLGFPKNLMEKLEPVIENMTSHEKYRIDDEFFNHTNMGHWSAMGDLEGLKYAHKNGRPWDTWTCAYAALNGHLECLKWLHAPDGDPLAELRRGCPWDKWTCAYAAGNGHLDCLKYLHEQGCPWDEWTCACAALNGHLDCLKWLHEQGCPWDEDTSAYAARYGRLECLKYARENGCPISEFCALILKKSGVDIRDGIS